LRTKITGRNNNSQLRPSPGEFVDVDTGGKPITESFMALPYRDVTGGLLKMMEMITGQAKQLSGAPEIPIGEGIQDVAVGTMLTAVDQATKVMTATHKGMHQAMSEEIQLIVELFRDNPEDFWRSNTIGSKEDWNEEKFMMALQKFQRRLVPVSDPNVPSHIHRIAKAVALMQVAASPIFLGRWNLGELQARILRAIREDPRGLVIEPPPQTAQPSLKDMADYVNANAKMKDAQTKEVKANLEARTATQKNQLTLMELGTKERVAQTDLQKELVIHAHDGERAKRQDMVAGLTAAHDAHSKMRDQALDEAQFQHQREQDLHQRGVDHRKLDIEQYKAQNPPKPAKPTGSKK
jgi:hypothetical protein